MANEQQFAIDITIEICGSAGDGSIAAGQILNLAMTEIGYHVMNFDSYPAEIRGFGKSVAHTRMSSKPIHTTGQSVDCLIALDDKHSVSCLPALRPDGVLLYDSKPMDYHEENEAIAGYIEPGMAGYGIPLRELSIKAVTSAQSRNIVSLGSIAAIFKIPKEAFHRAIKKRFAGKDNALIEANIKAFDLGFEDGARLDKYDPVDFHDTSFPRRESVTIISGNEAVAKGFLDADIRLYAGYPITPATKIMEIMAKKLPRQHGAIVQTEDEISAVGHAIGGGFAGKRSATATSGPGICLMVEFINLAVMAEVPVVIVDAQRGGPSTGLPTKTEQADLKLAIFGGSGDSPRAVLAPTRVEECYSLAIKAFEIAEAFQTPVIVLIDFFLSNRMEDVDWDDVHPDRFGSYQQTLADATQQDYKRFALTENGISPRAIPGMDNLYHTVTGLEHNEQGLPDYNQTNHRQMGEKRYKKMSALAAQWPNPEVTGPEGALDIGILSWGSTVGAAKEAIKMLQEQGIKAGGFFPRLMWPQHEEALKQFSDRCRVLLAAEANMTGQYADIVMQVVGRQVVRAARVYAGPYPSGDIVAAATEALNRDSKG